MDVDGLLKSESVWKALGVSKATLWRLIVLARPQLEPFIKARRGRGKGGAIYWDPAVVPVMRELREVGRRG